MKWATSPRPGLGWAELRSAVQLPSSVTECSAAAAGEPEACREAGTPEPRIRVEPGELWVEFPFSAAYLGDSPQAVGRIHQAVEMLTREPAGLDETEEDSARDRLVSARLHLAVAGLRLEQGDPGPIPSVEEAESYPYTPAEEARMMELATRFTVGAPEHVADRLSELAEAHGVSEVLIVTICHDPRARIRSYELIAEAFGIGTKTEGAEATASTPTC